MPTCKEHCRLLPTNRMLVRQQDRRLRRQPIFRRVNVSIHKGALYRRHRPNDNDNLQLHQQPANLFRPACFFNRMRCSLTRVVT